MSGGPPSGPVFGVLGPLQVLDRAGSPVPIPGAKARALLALLLTAPNRNLSSDLLADELWHGSAPPSARGTIQVHICRLRHAIGSTPAVIETREAGYCLAVDPAHVDASAFAGAVTMAHAESNPRSRCAHFDAALALWRGDAYCGLVDSDRLALEAERLAELRLAAIEDRTDAALAAGEHAALVGDLRQLTRRHPLRERMHGQLMLALYRCGQAAEALRAYQIAFRVLDEDLGVAPSTALRDLEAAIVRQDPALDLRVPLRVLTPRSDAGWAAWAQLEGLGRQASRAACRRAAVAGDTAMAGHAFTEAAAYYELAARHLEETPAGTPSSQAEAWLALGRARHAAYDREGAEAVLHRAIDRARAAQRFDLLGTAAVALAAVTEFTHEDLTARQTLEEARRRLGRCQTRESAQVTAALARLLPRDDPRAVTLAAEAVGSAAVSGDARTIATALGVRCLVAWCPDNAAERRCWCDQIVRLAGRCEYADIAAEAMNWRAAAAEQLGDQRSAAVDRAAVTTYAATSQRPFFLALDAMRATAEALADGDLDTAEGLLATPVPHALTSPDFVAAFGVQLFALRLAQGRAAELIDAVRTTVRGRPDVPAWGAVLATAELATGDTAAATAELHRLVGPREVSLPRDWLWLGATCMLADVCVAIGDRTRASALLAALAPFDDQFAVVAHGVLHLGPVAPRLAALEAIAAEVAAAAG